MSPLVILMAVALGLCVIMLGMTLWNLAQYQQPKDDGRVLDEILVSVCVPARNEEENLDNCVRGLLASTHANLEVLVYDDQSTDATPTILAGLLASDPRVRQVASVPLPAGWNGKQHACYRMAREARGRWLLFTDADVRCAPGAVRGALLAARAAAPGAGGAAGTGGAGGGGGTGGGKPEHGLVSTFPRQETASLAERLVVPMIFFILFSYLPFARMRRTKDPAASAGCGQFLLVRSDVYRAAGTHEAFMASMHDGVKLPRLVRKAGFSTDLFDGTALVSCRMYRDFSSVWCGFAKNAYEGLGSLALLLFLTLTHALAHVLPCVVWVLMLMGKAPTWAGLLAGGAIAVALAQRLVLALRLRTSVLGALLHPLGVTLMTLIQWHSYLLHLTGRRSWRGRTLSPASA
jgi:glycosyltransferase involved in cell wall biosynthesis